MDWGSLTRQVIGLGAPLIGQALGGPLGATAGRILADALGTAPTPAAVGRAIESSTDDHAAKAAIAAAASQAEAQWAEALAEIGKAQVAEIGATQRAEMASGDPLQRWWRPLYALELSLIECPAFVATLLHALWVGSDKAINGFGIVTSLLIAYFGARFGVLGVYVTGRTREKQALATGEATPSIVGEVVKAITRRGR
jgi:hypothetical protein